MVSFSEQACRIHLNQTHFRQLQSPKARNEQGTTAGCSLGQALLAPYSKNLRDQTDFETAFEQDLLFWGGDCKLFCVGLIGPTCPEYAKSHDSPSKEQNLLSGLLTDSTEAIWN